MRTVYVEASQTNAALTTRGTGSILNQLVISNGGILPGTVTLNDGVNTAMIILPTNTPLGVYHIPIYAASQNGNWRITTPAGCRVIATIGL